jgi:hypothetical protein
MVDQQQQPACLPAINSGIKLEMHIYSKLVPDRLLDEKLTSIKYSLKYGAALVSWTENCETHLHKS